MPWVYARDFNEIVSQAEKKGRGRRAKWQMRDFRQALDNWKEPNTVWERWIWGMWDFLLLGATIGRNLILCGKDWTECVRTWHGL